MFKHSMYILFVLVNSIGFSFAGQEITEWSDGTDYSVLVAGLQTDSENLSYVSYVSYVKEYSPAEYHNLQISSAPNPYVYGMDRIRTADLACQFLGTLDSTITSIGWVVSGHAIFFATETCTNSSGSNMPCELIQVVSDGGVRGIATLFRTDGQYFSEITCSLTLDVRGREQNQIQPSPRN